MTSDVPRRRWPARAERGEESSDAGAAKLGSPLGLVQPDTAAEFTADGEIPPGAETTQTYDPSAAARRRAARDESARPAGRTRRIVDVPETRPLALAKRTLKDVATGKQGLRSKAQTPGGRARRRPRTG
ncbi:MAG TPA: hypothetical protein VF342_03125 [Alphaproteobacteria bacterium]